MSFIVREDAALPPPVRRRINSPQNAQKRLRVRIVHDMLRVRANSESEASLALTIPTADRRPMMMRIRGGESRAPFSRLGRMAVALSPLPLLTLAGLYRNWRSLPPPIRSMEAPVPRRLGEARPPPPTTPDRTKRAYQTRLPSSEGGLTKLSSWIIYGKPEINYVDVVKSKKIKSKRFLY